MAGEREIEEKKRNCKTDKVKYLVPVTVLLYFLLYKNILDMCWPKILLPNLGLPQLERVMLVI